MLATGERILKRDSSIHKKRFIKIAALAGALEVIQIP